MMDTEPKLPRGLVIAAPSSGSGKTTVTLGLLAALQRRGVVVQPFKTGPDYLDTGHHERASGRPSYNLDTWAMPHSLIAGIVAEVAAKTDLAIVEGVMGLFDGGADKGLSGNGSTADLVALLDWPVVLVLDVSGQTETAAALALGCARYRPELAIAGVILNQVASERHLDLIRPGFERIGMRLFGGLRRNADLHLPERHLGLVQAGEHDDYAMRMAKLADAIEASIDVDGIVAAGYQSSGFPNTTSQAMKPPGQRIALARDAAFSFTYNHVLAGWRKAGAEIFPFSPLADEAPSAIADAVWLPGGYPELYAGQLAGASRFFSGLRALAERGIPIHGECGGYMVLGQGLEDAEGQRHAMAGFLKAETSFRSRKLHLGYRRAVLRSNCVLGRKGAQLYGHEFHYATLVSDVGETLMDVADGTGVIRSAGSRAGSVTGSFFHLLSAAETAA
jgi:cobyrinic acid a,c-diamide synthase